MSQLEKLCSGVKKEEAGILATSANGHVTLALFLLVCVLFTACAGGADTLPTSDTDRQHTESSQLNSTPTEELSIGQPSLLSGIDYSNLNDDEVMRSTRDLVLANGISKASVDHVFGWISDYNQQMGQTESIDLIGDFIHTDANGADYGEYYPYMRGWMDNYSYQDVLCRVAAFGLYKQFISADNWVASSEWDITDEDESPLYFDYKAITENPMVDFSEDEISTYFTLFNTISYDGTDRSQEAIAEAILAEWEQRGVAFAPDTKCKLVTFWFVPNEGDIIKSAHAAVMLETESGILLIEKTNPNYPYQITKLESESQITAFREATLRIARKNNGLDDSIDMTIYCLVNDEVQK